MNENYKKDIEIFYDLLPRLSKEWDGKTCILELKEIEFNWQQMEWWGFYLEHQIKTILSDNFLFPGERYGNVIFDFRGNINWDIKGSVAFNYNSNVILNDKRAMDQSLAGHGFHGEIIALFLPDFDEDGTFKAWHSDLKGGKSKYEIANEARSAASRRRKRRVRLLELIFVVLKKEDIENLGIMNQGRNSNGLPRNSKYMLNLRRIDRFEHYILKFA